MAQVVQIAVVAKNQVDYPTSQTIGIGVDNIITIETIPSTPYKAGNAVTRVTIQGGDTSVLQTTYDSVTALATVVTACNA
jgi:hypothetical protein